MSPSLFYNLNSFSYKLVLKTPKNCFNYIQGFLLIWNFAGVFAVSVSKVFGILFLKP